jgi:hypothetical protein
MPRDRSVKATFVRFGLLPAAFGAVVALGLSAFASSGRAADDDENQKTIGQKVMGVFGLKNPFDPVYDINYAERSPLVVPPNRNLPPPMPEGGPKVANWPHDADIEKRAASKKAEKPTAHADWAMESDRALRPDELNVPGANTAAKTAAPGATPLPPPPKKSFWSFDWLNPNKDEYVTFTGEPQRTTLTDPPPGYLTPSPDQPYGIGPEHVAPHVQTLGERMEPTR